MKLSAQLPIESDVVAVADSQIIENYWDLKTLCSIYPRRGRKIQLKKVIKLFAILVVDTSELVTLTLWHRHYLANSSQSKYKNDLIFAWIKSRKHIRKLIFLQKKLFNPLRETRDAVDLQAIETGDLVRIAGANHPNNLQHATGYESTNQSKLTESQF